MVSMTIDRPKGPGFNSTLCSYFGGFHLTVENNSIGKMTLGCNALGCNQYVSTYLILTLFLYLSKIDFSIIPADFNCPLLEVH